MFVAAMTKNRPRILHLVITYGETSPAYKEFSLPNINKYDITVCSMFPPDTSVPTEIRVINGRSSVIEYVRVLCSILKSIRYDVIHSHYAHVSVLFILAAILVCPSSLKASIYTVHTSYNNLKFRNKVLTALTFIFFNNIVFCSKSSEDSFPTWFKLLAYKRYTTIQNGVNIRQVDVALNSKRAETVLKLADYRITLVARLITLKNTEIVLEALANLNDPTIQLVIIGEGILKSDLEAKAKSLLPLNQVVFTGVIVREEVYWLLASSDLFISTSRIEGLPIAVLEAMAVGCPVILSDIAAHREISGRATWIPLIPPDDVEELAKAIWRHRSMTKIELSRIRRANRTLVEDRFNLERMLNEYHRIYNTIIDQHCPQ